MNGPVALGHYLNSFGGQLESAFDAIAIINIVAFLVITESSVTLQRYSNSRHPI